MHTIRISMSLRVNWNDTRVSVIAGSQSIYLSAKDQKRIWSPNMAINSNKISSKIEEEEFILEKKPDTGPVHLVKFWSFGIPQLLMTQVNLLVSLGVLF